ncbi:peptidase of plants and bacteria-domain-containing protein [Ampelomyces quisqualis]|uniref:Peptidase of plants and bacteria-domain-containing protein n=1 Tax=Ampelomyces quisqualis TaxID=50730 RepID=A0A6A5QCE9_AMPQU|nr:peptidase of plants and bacteria-domain-containing protein [Ampelomyces quisqualis]
MSSSTTIYYQTMSPTASSSTPPPPQSSALPPTSEPHHSNIPECADSNRPSPDTSKVIPFRKPLIRLVLRDLSSSGSRAFLRLVHASVALQDAVDTVLKLLYNGLHVSCIPPTRSVTLVIRDMEGVAYTTGLDIDQDHKEIHLSTNYIEFIPESRQKEEIMGVLVHEMVHCWQHSGFGKAPQGLIEGVADWVRLKAGYAPPHWKRHIDCDWDAGYERTGYFLEWLEKEHGVDIVQRLNEAMRDCKYDADKVWRGCCGQGVDVMWEKYKRYVEDDCGEGKKEKAVEEKAGITEAGPSSPTEDRPKPQEDLRTAREKARRGGNMHVPVRPKFDG